MNNLEILKAKVDYNKNYCNQAIMTCVPFIVTAYVLINQNKPLATLSMIAGVSFILIYLYYLTRYHKRYKQLIDFLGKWKNINRLR
jgi:Ca2+/Na+ antiporter